MFCGLHGRGTDLQQTGQDITTLSLRCHYALALTSRYSPRPYHTSVTFWKTALNCFHVFAAVPNTTLCLCVFVCVCGWVGVGVFVGYSGEINVRTSKCFCSLFVIKYILSFLSGIQSHLLAFSTMELGLCDRIGCKNDRAH